MEKQEVRIREILRTLRLTFCLFLASTCGWINAFFRSVQLDGTLASLEAKGWEFGYGIDKAFPDGFNPLIGGFDAPFINQICPVTEASVYEREVSQTDIDAVCSLDQLEALDISHFTAPIGTMDLRGLKRLVSLNRLVLSGGPNRNLTLENLNFIGSRKLTDLHVYECDMSGPKLTSLSQQSHMESLYLIRARLADEDLPRIAGVTSLRALSLSGNMIKGSTLGSLKSLTQLVELSLSVNSIEDRNLGLLSTLRNLQILHLSSNPITDEGLGHLVGLSSLKRISLLGTPVTSKGLLKLIPLKSLKIIEITDSNMLDPREIQELKQSNPGLVFWLS